MDPEPSTPVAAEVAEASPASAPASASQNRKNHTDSSIGSLFNGNKIKHIKKDDGAPLLRRDIQYDLLRCIFDDTTPCFHKIGDGTDGHTFADVYIDTVARSSKTSKVLRDKLLGDRNGAINIAMICLLVNIGRMNTTLNFFPEMRAQLRTFHSIPALQAGSDSVSYKQLQDAPRLKSILKAASDESPLPTSLEKVRDLTVPRTNPVHLIFLLSQQAPRVSEMHFHRPHDFFDIIMRNSLSSKSRAKALLWLLWWYLESDLSQDALTQNPFGPGTLSSPDDFVAVKVPQFEHLTESQAEDENVDTEEEILYGEQKRLERQRILESDELAGPPASKRAKIGAEGTPVKSLEGESVPSPSPSVQRIKEESSNAPSNPPRASTKPKLHPLRSKLELETPLRANMDTPSSVAPESSPPPHQAVTPHTASGAHAPPLPAKAKAGQPIRRSRGDNKVIPSHRRIQVDHILHRQMQDHQNRIRQLRSRSNGSFGMMIMNRIRDLDDYYDSEDEDAWGPGGLIPNGHDVDDFGEEALRHRKALDRAIRRLHRIEKTDVPALLHLPEPFNKNKRRSGVMDAINSNIAKNTKRKRDRHRDRARKRASVAQSAQSAQSVQSEPRAPVSEAALDELDLDLLGEQRDGNSDDESVSDGSEGLQSSMVDGDAGRLEHAL